MSEAELRAAFGNVAVDTLLARIASGTTSELDPPLFATALGFDEAKTRQFLEAAAAAGLAEARKIASCPNCGEPLDAEAAAGEQCPVCDEAFADNGGVVHRTVYRLEVRRTRDIAWLIAVHGFNTHGPWQQEFSWRIATKLKYSAPVLVYKYGLIRFSVLVRWRHRALARRLGTTIRAAMVHAKASRIPEPPDIVIHSFGSQLFVQLLALTEFDDLRFGRVIAAGSVVRPDYNWSQRIAQGRIEAIFNHCGGRDCAVPFAQFFIPGTGPGARHGFSDVAAINVLDSNYRHSSCFDMAELEANLADGGLWDRFLRRPPETFAEEPQRRRPAPWRPVWRPIRAGVRLVGVGLIVVIAGLVLTLVAIGCLDVLVWPGLERIR
ncbi:hypothetical protein E5673_18565 [Sphingomonas sp. PAMC26645]|uniref:hypothetical protein n=1 Tax=Sphingomonas sp. PAMC26645 TaxID=2565555 RepID=UPI00109D8F0B|nr:hypothetical protein [Sphingomonas sp. PAMC26645]QCB43975.1 hypothetical protein E5673_18565 [Sphingomonas sp. PAMC26645]